MKLIDWVKDQQVHFAFARESQLYYQTTSGFVFPVPMEDMGKGTFLRDDKAIYFMRYIHKHLIKVEEEKIENKKEI